MSARAGSRWGLRSKRWSRSRSRTGTDPRHDSRASSKKSHEERVQAHQLEQGSMRSDLGSRVHSESAECQLQAHAPPPAVRISLSSNPRFSYQRFECSSIFFTTCKPRFEQGTSSTVSWHIDLQNAVATSPSRPSPETSLSDLNILHADFPLHFLPPSLFVYL